METLLETLNPQQKEAAMTIDRPVRIVAGAGSGKTRVLMARIEYLIQEAGILPWRILAITFTNKAAGEMKERLHAQMPSEAANVKISTIHSLCVRILREDAAAAGFSKNFAILDADDQKSLLRRIYKEKNISAIDFKPAAVLSYISHHKSGDVPPEKAMEQAFSKESRMYASLYREYQRQLESMKAMDFDDLLIRAERLLRTDREVREKWQNRLDYVHVDEFQDVDEIQYQIIRHLCGPDTLLCVVGDPDQTIYTWRGAAVDIILNFDRDFPNTKTILLTQNYRSQAPILNAANALISHNRKRIKKDLYASLQGEDPIILHQSDEQDEEAEYTAGQIQKLRQEGTPCSDIAILYRNNYLSRSYEKALREKRIPYRIYGGIRFYERAEIKDILSYLHLLCQPDPEDPKGRSLDLAVLRVINQPKRKIGVKTIESIEAEARERDLSMLSVMKDPKTLSGASAKKGREFAALIESLRSKAQSMPLVDLVPLILEKTGYEAMLKEAKEEERLENVLELQNDIAQALLENPQLSLEEYLQQVSLFTDAREQQAEGVSLMTVHAAKGTEYPVVFAGGLCDDIFPSSRSLEENGSAGLEEERRLLYVAMTRAKKKLFLTWNHAWSFRTDGQHKTSRFIKEIPEEYTNWKSAKKGEPPKTKAAGAAKAASGKNPLHKGDHVVHTVFGEGVVIQTQGGFATIAFSLPHGVKKMDASHPTLSRVSS